MGNLSSLFQPLPIFLYPHPLDPHKEDRTSVYVEWRKRTLRKCLMLFKRPSLSSGSDIASLAWHRQGEDPKQSSPALGETPRPPALRLGPAPPFPIGSAVPRVTPATPTLPYQRGAGLGAREAGQARTRRRKGLGPDGEREGVVFPVSWVT